MYFDDNYDPNEANDYDDDSNSIDESIGTVLTNSNKNIRRKWMDDIKSSDPGYSYVTRLVKKQITTGLRVDVACNKNDEESFYSGKITRIGRDQLTFDILLDNGDKVNNVSKKRINFPYSVVKGTKTKIPFYATSLSPNMTIRNAVNGTYETGYKTGSNDEDLFFKVSLATGENGSKDSRILFFNDPEQYERYFNCIVSADTKDKWSKKANQRRLMHKSH